MIFIDRTLSQRLERAEAMANARFVEMRARITPAVEAEWIDVGGTYAMFDGIESPCTQTFGLGLFAEPLETELNELEQFFALRGANVYHEVSPLADPSLLPLLSDRGYRPIELSNVLCRAIESDVPDVQRRESEIKTRIIDKDEVEIWAHTSATGWGTEHEGPADLMYAFGLIGAQSDGSLAFLAELDGVPIATGSLSINDGVAVCAGASTIPAARNLGAQNALLFDRLRFAADQGCTIASMAALPGSQSQINAQKNGFQIAYTRTKWELKK